jgi:alpha-1,3/alpha-1,6-mannosyltransferase
VRVRGDSLFPPSIAGRFSILCAILRQLSLVFSTGVASSELAQLDPDVFIVDQLSACIPFFRIVYPKAKILFYGHFPDQKLIKQESGLRQTLKTFYRVPFDAIEGWSTACSDGVVVNSKFTRSIFKHVFPSMRSRELKVIYPCVDTNTFDPSAPVAPIWPDRKVLLSINRFESKKNLDLAVEAYAGLTPLERSTATLVLAGGYDPRNAENALCHKHLQTLAAALNLTHATLRNNDGGFAELSSTDVDVVFLLSIPNELKVRLLQNAGLLIYTPEYEHFGIVPLEAMLAGVPVLATNTGGPLETIYDGRTGWLRPASKVEQWTDVMRKPLIPSSAESLKGMGQRGRERVLAEFSQTKMAEYFDQELQRLARSSAPRPSITPKWVILAILATIFAVVLGFSLMFFTLWALGANGADHAAQGIRQPEL